MYNTFLLSMMDGGFELVQVNDWQRTTWPYHCAHAPLPRSFPACTDSKSRYHLFLVYMLLRCDRHTELYIFKITRATM